MSSLITFGCSFTEGGGLYNSEVARLYGYEVSEWRRFAWPSILARRLGMHLVDFSKCGSGSPRMYRKFWKYYLDDSIIKSETDVYIFEVPGSWYRLDYFSNTLDKYLLVNITDSMARDVTVTTDYIDDLDFNVYVNYSNSLKKYLSEWYNPHHVAEIQENELISFLSFLDRENIKCLFLPTIQLKSLYEKLKRFDLDKFCIDFNGTYDFMEYLSEEKLTIIDEIGFNDGHPGKNGHKKIAETIYESINNRW